MPPLNATPAPTAHTRLEIELSVDDRARDFGLILNERFELGQFLVSAIRTTIRQRNVVGLVDFFGCRSMMMLAMFLPALAARLLRIGFALFAERCRLAFAFAFDLLDPLFQQLDLLLQLLDNLQQDLAGRAIGIDGRHFHDAQILTDSCQIHQDRFAAR